MKDLSGKMSDSEIAVFLIKHIENPCETIIDGKAVGNVRSVYISEARKLLFTLENPYAIDMLQKCIDCYK